VLTTTVILAGLILLAALLYSSVGHAGASGYLAAMAFLSISPEVMRPTALVLNLLVASIATYRFARAGHFSLSLLWPFAIGSVPLAFVGGAVQLPGHWYKTLVGLVLLAAVFRLANERGTRDAGGEDRSLRHAPMPVPTRNSIGTNRASEGWHVRCRDDSESPDRNLFFDCERDPRRCGDTTADRRPTRPPVRGPTAILRRRAVRSDDADRRDAALERSGRASAAAPPGTRAHPRPARGAFAIGGNRRGTVRGIGATHVRSTR
jgi:hypothetical protein